MPANLVLTIVIRLHTIHTGHSYSMLPRDRLCLLPDVPGLWYTLQEACLTENALAPACTDTFRAGHCLLQLLRGVRSELATRKDELEAARSETAALKQQLTKL